MDCSRLATSSSSTDCINRSLKWPLTAQGCKWLSAQLLSMILRWKRWQTDWCTFQPGWTWRVRTLCQTQCITWWLRSTSNRIKTGVRSKEKLSQTECTTKIKSTPALQVRVMQQSQFKSILNLSPSFRGSVWNFQDSQAFLLFQSHSRAQHGPGNHLLSHQVGLWQHWKVPEQEKRWCFYLRLPPRW